MDRTLTILAVAGILLLSGCLQEETTTTTEKTTISSTILATTTTIKASASTTITTSTAIAATTTTKDVSEVTVPITTTATTMGTIESYSDAFRIASESSYINSMLEKYDCSSRDWNKISAILHVINRRIVECQRGGHITDYCSEIWFVDKISKGDYAYVRNLFGRDVEDYYALFYVCSDDVSFTVFVDSVSGEQAIRTNIKTPIGTACVGFAQVDCIDVSVQGLVDDGTVTVAFSNVAGQRINVVDLNVTGSCISDDGGLDGVMTERELKTVTFMDCGSPKAGEVFSVDVVIEYTVGVEGTVVHNREEGRVRGAWG